MKRAGQVVLFRFPQTDLQEGKLRPALLLGKLPGEGFAGSRISEALTRRRRRGRSLQSCLLRDVRCRPCCMLWVGADVNSAAMKTHRGLIAAFGEHLVKTARLTADLGKALNQVERIRLLADYTGEEVDADRR